MITDKYLIAFDMDGTLLAAGDRIGEKSKETIAELVAQGHTVTVATGRPPRVALPFYKQTGMNGPLVCYNGGLVFKPDDTSFATFKKMFAKEDLIRFIDGVGYDKFRNLMAEDDDTIYVNKPSRDLDGFFHHQGMKVRKGMFTRILDSDTYTLIIGMNSHDLDERLVKCAFSLPDVGLRFWGGAESKFSELYFLDTSKTSGLELVRKRLGFDKDHVIVVGDADNDVEMLTEYSNSIAMLNGEKQVKARARYVSDYDNEHDGAALAVAKVLSLLQSKRAA